MNEKRGGFILLPRSILQSNIWREKPKWWIKVWIYLLLEAKWKDSTLLKRGQIHTTYAKVYQDCRLAEEGIKPNSIKSLLKSLQTCGQISHQKSRRGLVITICNYDSYQDGKSYKIPTEIPPEIPTKSRQKSLPRKRKESNKEYICSVFDFWNSQKIIIHKQMTETHQGAINSKLKVFGLDDILETIANYAKIVNDKKYRFSYRWTLTQFFQRENGYETFRSENDPFGKWLNFDIQEKQITANKPEVIN